MASAATASAQPQDGKGTDFQTYVQRLWPQAEKRGVTRQTFDLAFSGIAPDPGVVTLTQRQAEYGRPVGTYIAGAIAPGRLSGGAAQMSKWADTLAAVEKQFGVDPAIIVAIWGMETSYGAAPGDKDVIRSMVTLAASGYREEFYREELLHALTILQEGHIARSKMTGSWAGAMGQPQFIPSSFVKWAVDFSGDGKRDIWTNVPDVLGSIANYFRKNGWTPGMPWGFEVAAAGEFRFQEKPRRIRGMGRARLPPRRRRRVSGATARPISCSRAARAGRRSSSPTILSPSGATTNPMPMFWRSRISPTGCAAARRSPANGPPTMCSRRATSASACNARSPRADTRSNNFVGQIDFEQRDGIRAEQAKAGLRADGHPDAALLEWLAKPAR